MSMLAAVEEPYAVDRRAALVKLTFEPLSITNEPPAPTYMAPFLLLLASEFMFKTPPSFTVKLPRTFNTAKFSSAFDTFQDSGKGAVKSIFPERLTTVFTFCVKLFAVKSPPTFTVSDVPCTELVEFPTVTFL